MAIEKQHAALPYVVCNGELEILLLTSRDTRRWVIPKGWPKKSMSASELAALEAYEEAGLKGRIDREPLGEYHYIKRLKGEEEVLCRVDVYPLLVESQCLDWPEKGQRKLEWTNPARAAQLVNEKELAWLLKSFAPNGAAATSVSAVATMKEMMKRLLMRAR